MCPPDSDHIGCTQNCTRCGSTTPYLKKRPATITDLSTLLAFHFDLELASQPVEDKAISLGRASLEISSGRFGGPVAFPRVGPRLSPMCCNDERKPYTTHRRQASAGRPRSPDPFHFETFEFRFARDNGASGECGIETRFSILSKTT
jgi:hypothetical protein